jgi:hypothetical protein
MTQGELQSILHYNPRTGQFTRLVTTGNASQKGDVLTGPVQIGGRTFQLHRLAFLYMTGSVPNYVKFIDNDRSNTKWSNLASGVK